MQTAGERVDDGVDSTMRRPGLTGAAHCNELVILTVCDDARALHRTNFNSYIRHKSEFRIMPENFTIRHTSSP